MEHKEIVKYKTRWINYGEYQELVQADADFEVVAWNPPKEIMYRICIKEKVV